MPRDITVTFDDGSTHVYRGAPDNITPDQVSARAAQDFGKAVTSLDGGRKPTLVDGVKQQAANAVGGAIRGAGSIGATILYPVDKITDMVMGDREQGLGSLVTGKAPESRNEQRRRMIDEGLTSLIGSDPNSLLYKTGKLGAEIAGTAGTGGALAQGVARVAPGLAAAAPGVMQAIETAGMAGGSMPARMAGGAITGAASAGLVNPADAVSGGVVGGILPPAIRGVGAVANAAGSVVRKAIPAASPEVAALADRAQQLGIPIPADRIVNSRPMNALAASLNYVPFSGRAATEAKMAEGLNTAVSRTMGQNTPNVNKAMDAASADLGAKFDAVLQSNAVKMTPGFKTALADIETQANSELGADAAKIIRNQIAELQTKGVAGQIDGQAAYNIKKTLDRIGRRNTPEAFYARDLRNALMDALNDSLGTQGAAEFGALRNQYRNMLALEGLAQNGAEGGVSAARLANMRGKGGADLQELSDIAAQFMRARENPHGAAQRVTLAAMGGAGAYGLGGLAALPIGASVGRSTNALLNSQAGRNFALGRTNALASLVSPEIAQIGYRSAPVLQADR